LTGDLPLECRTVTYDTTRTARAQRLVIYSLTSVKIVDSSKLILSSGVGIVSVCHYYPKFLEVSNLAQEVGDVLWNAHHDMAAVRFSVLGFSRTVTNRNGPIGPCGGLETSR
jgi:hypothetical protein